MYDVHAIYSIKLICIDTFVKQIKIQLVHFVLLKCSIQILQKFLLCILKCHWLEVLKPIHGIPCKPLLTTRHQIYKIFPFFEGQSLSFRHHQLKFILFSIPNTPGHLNTHIKVNVYRLIDIRKQKTIMIYKCTCMYTC